MKIYVKSIIVMVCLCLVMGLLLALVYNVTAPVIAENEKKANQAALEAMFPGASFTQLTLADDAPAAVTALYRVDDDHYAVVNLSIVTGYTTGETTFVMGVNTDNMTITKLQFISYNESVDCSAAFPDSFAGQGATLDGVTTASPAVYTRAAVKEAVAAALAYLASHPMVETEAVI